MSVFYEIRIRPVLFRAESERMDTAAIQARQRAGSSLPVRCAARRVWSFERERWRLNIAGIVPGRRTGPACLVGPHGSANVATVVGGDREGAPPGGGGRVVQTV